MSLGDDDDDIWADDGGGGDSTSENTIQSETDATTNLLEAHLGCYDDHPRIWHPNQNLKKAFEDDNSPAK